VKKEGSGILVAMKIKMSEDSGENEVHRANEDQTE
jgi:hypothetical protein